MDALAVIALIGGASLLAGLFGGFKAKEFDVPPLPVAIRFLSVLVGLAFTGFVVWRLVGSTTVNPSPTNNPNISSTQAVQPTYTPYPTHTPFPILAGTTQVNESVTPIVRIVVVTATSRVAPIKEKAIPIPTIETANPKPPVLTQPVNCNATPHVALRQGNHFFEGAVHVAELWRSNGNAPWGVGLRRAVVYGNLSIVGAGGSVWTYPAGCENIVEAEVHNNPSAVVILEKEMRDAGFIR